MKITIPLEGVVEAIGKTLLDLQKNQTLILSFDILVSPFGNASKAEGGTLYILLFQKGEGITVAWSMVPDTSPAYTYKEAKWKIKYCGRLLWPEAVHETVQACILNFIETIDPKMQIDECAHHVSLKEILSATAKKITLSDSPKGTVSIEF